MSPLLLLPLLSPLLVGCGRTALPPLAPPQAEVVATVADKHVALGQPIELEVQARALAGTTIEVAPPAAEGLSFSAGKQTGPTQVGEAQVRTWTYELTGPKGSYVIQPGAGTATDADGKQRQIDVPPVFVDIGVPGPLAKGLSDFEAPPPPSRPPYALYAALGVGALALVGAGLGIRAWMNRRPEPVEPPVPAHVLARRQWERVRIAGLGDHPQAVALSQVLRGYLEAITGWPATMRTGPEILRWMEEDAVAGASARLHAARILDATDRLKFARQGGGGDFFEAMDRDFDVVVEATRPSWEPPQEAAPAPPDDGGEA